MLSRSFFSRRSDVAVFSSVDRLEYINTHAWPCAREKKISVHITICVFFFFGYLLTANYKLQQCERDCFSSCKRASNNCLNRNAACVCVVHPFQSIHQSFSFYSFADIFLLHIKFSFLLLRCLCVAAAIASAAAFFSVTSAKEKSKSLIWNCFKVSFDRRYCIRRDTIYQNDYDVMEFQKKKKTTPQTSWKRKRDGERERMGKSCDAGTRMCQSHA